MLHALVRPHDHEWRHLRVRWLSDVVAGSALGFGIGRAVVRRNSRPPTPPGGPTPPQPEKPSGLELGPDLGPAADGVGLQLRLRF